MIACLAPPAYSGAGTQALALAVGLQSQGVKSELLTYNRVRARRVEVIEGVTVRRCGGERLVRRLPYALRDWSRLLIFTIWSGARLSVGHYDVYHVHGNYLYALPAAILSRLRKVPLIVKVTLLGDDDAETHARRGRGPVSLGWLFNFSSRNASTLIATNEEVARRHQVHFPDVPVAEFSNGVDVARFAFSSAARASGRRALRIDDDTFVALFVGYLQARKGVTELLEGWLQFVESRPAGAPKVALLLAGPDQDFSPEFSSRAADLASSARAKQAGVRVLGHVPPERMPQTYASADVFVLPTSGEGMPNSLLEALAAGLPALATSVPGVVDVLADEPDSVLVARASASEIAQALSRFASRLDASTNGARPSRLPARYSLAHTAERYRALYEALAHS